MGTLLTMLALASVCAAPEPTQDASAAPASAAAQSEPGQPEPEATPEPAPQQPLRPVDFRPRAQTLHASRPAYDLRNPFDQHVQPPGGAEQARGATGSTVGSELRDPFSKHRPNASPSRRRSKPGRDLRNPFQRPKALPKCPDTGGVPIQRPTSVRPGCVQASRRAAYAQR